MTGVTNASLNTGENCPAAGDRLNSSVRNGAISVATCFSTDTGSGSAAELLSGSFMIPATISQTVIAENDDKGYT